MTILYIINHTLEAAGFYFYTFFLYSHIHSRFKDILATAFCYTGLYFVYLKANILLNLSCMFIVYMLLLFYYVRRPFLDTLIHVIINLIIIEIAEQLVDFSFFLFKEDTSFIVTTRQYVIASVAVRAIHYILALIIILCLRRWPKLDVFPLKYKRITLIFTAITLISLISLQTLGLSTTLESNHVLWLYILEITIISLSIGVLITLTLMCSYQSELLQLRCELQRDEDVRNYNQLLEQQDTEQRILIHDTKNHLLNLHALLQQKDYTTATNQIEHLLRSPAITNVITFSNNQSLNLLLARYQTFAREHDILLSVDIKGVDLSFLTPDDVTALFCNVLDNAVEASSNCANAHIHFRISNGPSSGSVQITVINTCNQPPQTGRFGDYISTKKDRLHHGFGLKSIERVAKKHHGMLETHFDKKENEFHIIILLYRPGEKE